MAARVQTPSTHITFVKWRDDPFLPQPIKDAVVEYLSTRSREVEETIAEVAQQFWRELKQPTFKSEWYEPERALYHRVIDRLRTKGFGERNVMESIARLRGEIEPHLTKFHP